RIVRLSTGCPDTLRACVSPACPVTSVKTAVVASSFSTARRAGASARISRNLRRVTALRVRRRAASRTCSGDANARLPLPLLQFCGFALEALERFERLAAFRGFAQSAIYTTEDIVERGRIRVDGNSLLQ